MERTPLRSLLGNRGFLVLLATRLVGSLGDGLFQAALASFVLFSPERQPTPLAIATTFGVLLLPYSLIGPFAGVFLDRWQRRQVLVRANWLRAVALLATIAVVSNGGEGLDLGAVVLVALGLSRFVLSGLSASLPHVVPRHELVTANALAPTAGTVVFGLGAVLGLGLRSLLGGGDLGVEWVLAVGALTYMTAGMIPLAFAPDRLGPSGESPGESMSDVVHGLVDGFRVLVQDPPSWQALTVIFIHRIAFGSITVLLLLLLRNTIHPVTEPEAALRDFSIVAALVTTGAFLAALLTPRMTRRMGTVAWTSLTLIICAFTAPAALIPVSVITLAMGGVVIGLSQQVAKIGADTTLQKRIVDDHLGRVFSIYDVGVNVCLVIGALLVAVLVPLSGVTVPGFIGLGVVYLITGLWYFRTGRRRGRITTKEHDRME